MRYAAQLPPSIPVTLPNVSYKSADCGAITMNIKTEANQMTKLAVELTNENLRYIRVAMLASRRDDSEAPPRKKAKHAERISTITGVKYATRKGLNRVAVPYQGDDGKTRYRTAKKERTTGDDYQDWKVAAAHASMQASGIGVCATQAGAQLQRMRSSDEPTETSEKINEAITNTETDKVDDGHGETSGIQVASASASASDSSDKAVTSCIEPRGPERHSIGCAERTMAAPWTAGKTLSAAWRSIFRAPLH